ncbi:MAG: DUF1194 domain-containing protein [Rhizobiaceae bacterium]|nr:DUF1194 domain-containing protein [Rhizobiaceae bacterium]
MLIAKICLSAILVLLFPVSHSFALEEVDVELVMAVDGSGSVSPEEMHLQFQGYIDAFRNPVIQNAMRSGPTGKVAVSLVVWSDRYLPKLQSEWFRISSVQDAEGFAQALESLHEQVKILYITKGGTEIGAGIGYSLAMLDNNKFNGLRKIIDVSGDGIETRPYSNSVMRLPQARIIAQSRQVIINGLAIANDFYNLARYYRENVISGPGSFVIEAKDFNDFGEAIHRKLLREFSSQVSNLRQ